MTHVEHASNRESATRLCYSSTVISTVEHDIDDAMQVVG